MRAYFLLLGFLQFFFFQTLEAQSVFLGMVAQGGQHNGGTIFKCDGKGNNTALAHDFFRFDGDYPKASLVKARDGKFYGMTSSCCVFEGKGVIFQYDAATSTYKKKYDFGNLNNGSKPLCTLVEAKDGMLYGTTTIGGVNNNGVVFQFNPITSVYTKKIDFENVTTGKTPQGSMIEAGNGKLYGMTCRGGANDMGVIYEYDPVTSVFTKKIDFDGINGSAPLGALLNYTNGKLYGMTSAGGNNDDGVFFEYDPTTNSLIKKFDFISNTGRFPSGSLMLANDGNMYGLTTYGGANDLGTLFQINTTSFTFQKNIDLDSQTGSNPWGDLMQAKNGKLYGLTYNGGMNEEGTIFNYDIQANTLKKEYDFTGITGKHPIGSLLEDTDGSFYSLTYDGGLHNVGVLFKYDHLQAKYTKKIDFHSADNGSVPAGALTSASNGKLYGCTQNGGSKENGLLFQFDYASSSYFKLEEFNGLVTGNSPTGSLLEWNDGNLYGMCTFGGVNNKGVVFQYDIANNSINKILDFDGVLTGANPMGYLVNGKDGWMYGMTNTGGLYDKGTMFKLNPVNGQFQKLIDFDGTNSGGNPRGSLLLASNGIFYGLTYYGGENDFGILFSYSAITGLLSNKMDFDGTTNGKYPEGSLVEGADGMLYGLTWGGGLIGNSDGSGVLFQFNPVSAVLTNKFVFGGSSNGQYPLGELLNASDGNLYGMTTYGGQFNYGTTFQYNLQTNTVTKKFDFDGVRGKYPVNNKMIELMPFSSLKENNIKDLDFEVYPVPAQNRLVIDLKSASQNVYAAKIITIHGQDKLRLSTVSDKCSFDVSELVPGVYILELQGKDGFKRLKFIKE